VYIAEGGMHTLSTVLESLTKHVDAEIAFQTLALADPYEFWILCILACLPAALQEAGADLAAKRLAEPQQQQQPEPESSEEADEEPESKPEPPGESISRL
jgi:hypothetical protein